MSNTAELGGTFTFPGTELTVHRMGYGAMQLAGPHVWGPPKDREAALAVAREAVAAGIDHIDTSDFYGPHVTNQILREALHPYPNDLTIVTKVGARRGNGGSWLPAASPAELTTAIHDNLRNLGLETLAIVNYRVTALKRNESSIARQIETLAELKRQGLIRHIGISSITMPQLKEARAITEIVCVQNEYNIAQREDDAMIESLAADGIAYVPFFPLGGFTPLQSSALDTVAAGLGATAMQVALAWLLQRSPNILLIPGTSSSTHLRENIAAAALRLPPDAVATLDGIGAKAAVA